MSVTYATFSWPRTVRQASHALSARHRAGPHITTTLQRLQSDQERLEDQLQAPLRNKSILEIGPGQHMLRARALGVCNEVTAIDQDVIPRRASDYIRMARRNGVGRVIKTLGRKALLVDQRYRRQLRRSIGVKRLTDPRLLTGDVCQLASSEQFDVACSWSVFEHIHDPEAALRAVLDHLRPGGAFLISVHLYTSNSGHHDIRAFAGGQQQLPLWGHLRPSTQHLIVPSAYLNHYRLEQWRELFQRVVPNVEEYQERHGESQLREAMTPELRRELGTYADEELFTVDLVFLGRKPSTTADPAAPPARHSTIVQPASAGNAAHSDGSRKAGLA